MTNNRTASNSPTVGVLALQGAYDAHVKTLTALGATPVSSEPRPNLRRKLDGLIMPGGESTTMLKFLERNGFFDVLQNLRPHHPHLRHLRRSHPARQRRRQSPAALPRRPRHHRRAQRLRPPDRLHHPHRRDRPPRRPARDGLHPRPAHHPHRPRRRNPRHPRRLPRPGPSGHLLAATFHPELSHDTRVHQLFLDLIALLSRSRRPPATVASISSRNAACTKTSQTRYPA